MVQCVFYIIIHSQCLSVVIIAVGLSHAKITDSLPHTADSEDSRVS